MARMAFTSAVTSFIVGRPHVSARHPVGLLEPDLLIHGDEPISRERPKHHPRFQVLSDDVFALDTTRPLGIRQINWFDSN